MQNFPNIHTLSNNNDCGSDNAKESQECAYPMKRTDKRCKLERWSGTEHQYSNGIMLNVSRDAQQAAVQCKTTPRECGVQNILDSNNFWLADKVSVQRQ